MTTYIIRRLLIAIVVLFFVSLAVFLMLHLVPGDPVEMLSFSVGQTTDMDAIRERLGLNDPLPVQYYKFLSNALQGDLGRTIRGNRPVTEEFFSRFPNTLKLVTASIFIAFVFGSLVGIASALRPNSLLDFMATGCSIFWISMPSFWLGLMLIFLFSVRLGWLPTSGATTWKHFVLPAFALSMLSMASIARLVRSSLLDVLQEDYIRTAKAKGLSRRNVIGAHALKNSLIPAVTVAGLQFGHLLGGAVVIEMVFAIPGVGRMVVDGILARDFPLVQGSVLFLAVGVVLTNLFVDIIYVYLDPRIRYG